MPDFLIWFAFFVLISIISNTEERCKYRMQKKDFANFFAFAHAHVILFSALFFG